MTPSSTGHYLRNVGPMSAQCWPGSPGLARHQCRAVHLTPEAAATFPGKNGTPNSVNLIVLSEIQSAFVQNSNKNTDRCCQKLVRFVAPRPTSNAAHSLPPSRHHYYIHVVTTLKDNVIFIVTINFIAYLIVFRTISLLSFSLGIPLYSYEQIY